MIYLKKMKAENIPLTLSLGFKDILNQHNIILMRKGKVARFYCE